MNSLIEIDAVEEARSIYQPEQAVSEIDTETARRIGRTLFEQQYNMPYANVVRSGSGESVERLLWQIDHSHKIRDLLAKNPNMFVGPYYQEFNGEVFCPQGVGVWVPNQE